MPAAGQVYAAGGEPEEEKVSVKVPEGAPGGAGSPQLAARDGAEPRAQRRPSRVLQARDTIARVLQKRKHVAEPDREGRERTSSNASVILKCEDEHERHIDRIARFVGVVSEAQHQTKSTNMDNRFVIVPTGRFRRRWDIVVLLFLAYTATFSPFQISFLSDDQQLDNIEDWALVFAVDRVVDLVFTLDIVFNFRTAWFTDEGNLHFDARQAARMYLRGWLALDVLSILPYSAISHAAGLEGSESALRLPKLLRLFRLLKIAKVLRASRIFKRWEQSLNVRYGWIRLGSFALSVALLSHWMACALQLVSSFVDEDEETWLTVLGLEDAGATRRYSVAIYWATMTLTTIGYGDVSAHNNTERAFMVVAMLVGAGAFAYVVGTMCSLVQGLQASSLHFQGTMDSLNEYMDRHSLPTTLRQRIRKFLFYKRDVGESVLSDELIMNNLSPALCSEVAVHNYGEVLKLVPQFADAPHSFLTSVSGVLGLAIFGPSEIIFRQDAPGDTMYILKRGRVQTETYNPRDGLRVIHTLDEGSHFGERALLFGASRPFTTRTLTFCQTNTLVKRDLDPILLAHPEVWREVRKQFIKDLLLHDMSRERFEELLPELREIRRQVELEDASSSSDDSGDEVAVLGHDHHAAAAEAGAAAAAEPKGTAGGLEPLTDTTRRARRRSSALSLDGGDELAQAAHKHAALHVPTKITPEEERIMDALNGPAMAGGAGHTAAIAKQFQDTVLAQLGDIGRAVVDVEQQRRDLDELKEQVGRQGRLLEAIARKVGV